MDLGLKGRPAIVTGGSRGIGKAAARALAREGCNVAICARNRAPLEEAAAEIGAESGRRVLPIVCDTLDAEAIADFVDQAAREFGGVQILVNNAAFTIGAQGNFEDAVDSEILRDFDEKVLGYLRCAQATAPYMKDAGWGRIVHVSGVTGRLPSELVSAGLRNIAIVNLSKSMANRLGPFGVTSNVVYPGMTITERDRAQYREQAEREGRTEDEVIADLAAATPARHIATAAEVADVIAFLCSPVAVAITGSAIEVSGNPSQAVHL